MDENVENIFPRKILCEIECCKENVNAYVNIIALVFGSLKNYVLI